MKKPINVPREGVVITMKGLVCPNCGTSEIRYRVRGRDYYCRRCGTVFTAQPFKGKWSVTIKRSDQK